MKMRPPSGRSDPVLRGVRAVLSVAVVFASAVIQAPASDHPVWGVVVAGVHRWGWAVILVGTVAGTWLLTGWINRAGSPKLRRVLDEVLSQFRDNLFRSAGGDHGDHRVTLCVDRNRPRSRSLAGFPVDKPDGQRWGVLVLDSTNPTLNSQRAAAEYRTCHGKVLGRIMGEL